LVGWAGWKLIFPFAVELCRFGFSVSTSLWSSVGASAMENAEVMVDDGGADLFNICTLLIGSFCNISSDSVRGVENRAERTWSSRRGPSALRCTDIWSGFPYLTVRTFSKLPCFEAAPICMASTPGCCQSTDGHVSYYKLAPEFAPDSGIYSSGTMQSKPKRTLKNT
ncbi:hypothetical protein T09_4384, partial [Trichinella sp. T9]